MKMILNMITHRTRNFTLVIILLCSICSGCHTTKIDTTTMHTASKSPIALGVIGIQKDELLHSEFQVAAIPEYKNIIRVDIKTVEFSQKTFNRYIKASKDNTAGIKYIDSLKNKPHFVTVNVVDRVTMVAELGEVYNSQTLAYLKGQKKATIISSVSLAIQKQYIEDLKTAEAVFLSNTPYKQYQLSLVRKGKMYKTIDFSKASIFAYENSFFCWGENIKKQIVLSGILDKNSSCPKRTYRNAEKATKKLNYFKL